MLGKMPFFGKKYDPRVTQKYSIKETLGKYVIIMRFAVSSSKICCEILFIVGIRRGAFSEVVKAQDRESGIQYAIKIIDKKQLKGKEEALQNEIDVLRRWVEELGAGIHSRCFKRGGCLLVRL